MARLFISGGNYHNKKVEESILKPKEGSIWHYQRNLDQKEALMLYTTRLSFVFPNQQ